MTPWLGLQEVLQKTPSTTHFAARLTYPSHLVVALLQTVMSSEGRVKRNAAISGMNKIDAWEQGGEGDDDNKDDNNDDNNNDNNNEEDSNGNKDDNGDKDDDGIEELFSDFDEEDGRIGERVKSRHS